MVVPESSAQRASFQDQGTRSALYSSNKNDSRGIGGIVDAMQGFKAREGMQHQEGRQQPQQQQQWDSSTYAGLLNILENSRAPISASCTAVEECLNVNKDNLRGFFEQCFAPLVANIFGYSMNAPGQGGWLYQVGHDMHVDKSSVHASKGLGKDSTSVSSSKSRAVNDVVALRRLLAPKGKLFMAMYNADCDGTIKFHFPKQRLPRMTQIMMNGLHRMLTIWPQYSEQSWQPGEEYSKVTEQHLHVSVFQYFCYWFAFYAINSLSSNRDCGGSHFQNFGKRMLHLRGSSSSRSSRGQRSMYLVLLRDLLHEFLPRPIDTSEDEGLKMPLMTNNALISSYQSKPGTGIVFLSILLEFWLKDADELWLKDMKSKTSSRSWGSSYEPPGENMLAAIEELTKYITVYQTRDGNFPAQAGSSWLPVSAVLYEPKDIFDLKGQSTAKSVLQGPRMLGISASIGPQAYSRQLYRLLHRALSSWPDQKTIKPLLKVFVAVLAPWEIEDDGRKSDSKSASTMLSGLAKSVGLDSQHNSMKKRANEYSTEWEHHVLSHLPFYLDLVPLFLEISISRVGARGETSVNDVLKILRIFEKSEALVILLQVIERDANRCFASQPRRAEGSHAELIPWIIDQAENWKQFAQCDTQGMPRQQNKEFGDIKNRKLFRMFSTRIPCASCSARDILCLSAGILKPTAQKSVETSFAKVLPLSDIGNDVEDREDVRAGGGGFQFDTVRKIPKNTWKDVSFKGNDLAKPKTSYEVPYLLEFMIHLSKKLNASIGLDVPCHETEFPETVIQEAIYALRTRGWIVNLRPLADYRNVIWGFVLVWILRLVLSSRLFFY